LFFLLSPNLRGEAAFVILVAFNPQNNHRRAARRRPPNCVNQFLPNVLTLFGAAFDDPETQGRRGSPSLRGRLGVLLRRHFGRGSNGSANKNAP